MMTLFNGSNSTGRLRSPSTEVTRGEFETFIDRSRYRTEARQNPGYGCRGIGRGDSSRRWNRPGFDQTARHPVTCVSIRDAMAYTRWAVAGNGPRLSASERGGVAVRCARRVGGGKTA